jgi:cytochrome b involved in lipid metabolism
MNKALYAGIGILIIAAIGIAVVQMQPQASTGSEVAQQPSVTPSPSDTPVTPAPAATSTQPATTPASSGITAAEVAQHNSAQSCYAIVGTSVYDLTQWINQHPGGARAILGLCGRDGTAQFTRQHGGQAQAESALASLRIAALAK